MTTRFSHLSLAPGKRWCRVLMCRGAVLLKHKISAWQPAHVWYAVASEQESCRATACPLHFDTKSEQSDCNKSIPVLGKNVEHPPLTRWCRDMGWVRWKMYRVFQEKLHNICRTINSELFVLGLWCLHQNVQQSLLSIDQWKIFLKLINILC